MKNGSKLCDQCGKLFNPEERTGPYMMAEYRIKGSRRKHYICYECLLHNINDQQKKFDKNETRGEDV